MNNNLLNRKSMLKIKCKLYLVFKIVPIRSNAVANPQKPTLQNGITTPIRAIFLAAVGRS